MEEFQLDNGQTDWRTDIRTCWAASSQLKMSDLYPGLSPTTPIWKESFQTGMHHSRVECIIPDWNAPFQDKPSDYWISAISQHGMKIGKKEFQVQYPYNEPEFWGWLSYPNSSTSLECCIPDWNGAFQTGMMHSRLECTIPKWKNIYWLFLTHAWQWGSKQLNIRVQ